MKYTLEQVRKMFLDKGCILLSTVYVHSHAKGLEYRCKCGNISSASLINFRKSEGCYSCANKKRWADPEYKKVTVKKMTNTLRVIFSNQDYKDKIFVYRKDKLYRRNISNKCKQKWQDKDYVERVRKGLIKSLNIHPNKPESILNELLGSLFQNEYKFVGNYKLWIEKFCPDFINCNGQKKIIELYGDYWHSKSQVNDAKRLKTYKKYGYQTLVIWENELKDLDRVKNKLIEFHNNGVYVK